MDKHSLLKQITYKNVFMSFRNICKVSQCRVEKESDFVSNNLHQMFPVIVNQTCRRSGGILHYYSLQNRFSSAICLGCLEWITLLRSCQSISAGLRSGLGLSRRRVFFCRSHSVANILLCFGLLSCCITQLLKTQHFILLLKAGQLWPTTHLKISECLHGVFSKDMEMYNCDFIFVTLFCDIFK